MALCSDCKLRATLGCGCTQCKECWDLEAKFIAEVCGKSIDDLTSDILKKIDDRIGSLPAENNHVCPHCKNDKVSKKEKSCWKCGGEL